MIKQNYKLDKEVHIARNSRNCNFISTDKPMFGILKLGAIKWINIGPKKKRKSIEEILGLVPVKHDLFISYAHSDNHEGLVDKILKKIKEIYRALTGEQLRIFIDRTGIMTADLWQDRISVELRQSRLLLAILSPSYFKSEWCRREWFMAENKEKKIKIFQGSSLISGAIVPILIYPLKRARLSEEEKLLVSTAKGRQWQDLSETKPGTAKSLQLTR